MTHLFKLWLVCLYQYLQMSLFRSTPAHLPYNPYSLLLTIFAYMGVGFVLLSEERNLLSILTQILIEISILYLICSAVLRLSGRSERILQTLSALIGVNLVIGFVSIPVYQMLPPSTGEQIDPLTIKITLAILLWNLAALSLIFRRAFEINTLTAGFIALNYFLLYEFAYFSLLQAPNP